MYTSCNSPTTTTIKHPLTQIPTELYDFILATDDVFVMYIVHTCYAAQWCNTMVTEGTVPNKLTCQTKYLTMLMIHSSCSVALTKSFCHLLIYISNWPQTKFCDFQLIQRLAMVVSLIHDSRISKYNTQDSMKRCTFYVLWIYSPLLVERTFMFEFTISSKSSGLMVGTVFTSSINIRPTELSAGDCPCCTHQQTHNISTLRLVL